MGQRLPDALPGDGARRSPAPMDAGLLGWIGAACLVAGGAGWGAQVTREGVTWPALALVVGLTGVGLTLTARALLAGSDLPLILGAAGALAGSALMVFACRDE